VNDLSYVTSKKLTWIQVETVRWDEIVEEDHPEHLAQMVLEFRRKTSALFPPQSPRWADMEELDDEEWLAEQLEQFEQETQQMFQPKASWGDLDEEEEAELLAQQLEEFKVKTTLLKDKQVSMSVGSFRHDTTNSQQPKGEINFFAEEFDQEAVAAHTVSTTHITSGDVQSPEFFYSGENSGAASYKLQPSGRDLLAIKQNPLRVQRGSPLDNPYTVDSQVNATTDDVARWATNLVLDDFTEITSDAFSGWEDGAGKLAESLKKHVVLRSAIGRIPENFVLEYNQYTRPIRKAAEYPTPGASGVGKTFVYPPGGKGRKFFADIWLKPSNGALWYYFPMPSRLSQVSNTGDEEHHSTTSEPEQVCHSALPPSEIQYPTPLRPKHFNLSLELVTEEDENEEENFEEEDPASLIHVSSMAQTESEDEDFDENERWTEWSQLGDEDSIFNMDSED
jgi:hypothetical protein